jgi:hypothetical protein
MNERSVFLVLTSHVIQPSRSYSRDASHLLSDTDLSKHIRHTKTDYQSIPKSKSIKRFLTKTSEMH